MYRELNEWRSHFTSNTSSLAWEPLIRFYTVRARLCLDDLGQKMYRIRRRFLGCNMDWFVKSIAVNRQHFEPCRRVARTPLRFQLCASAKYGEAPRHFHHVEAVSVLRRRLWMTRSAPHPPFTITADNAAKIGKFVWLRKVFILILD